MKNILAIDTCTEVCSVSLYSKGEVVSRYIKGVAKSSGLVLVLCDEIFEQTGVSVADLDVIVYTKGPGAFTGVRMCVSVVQGMSLAYDITTVGFSTLEVVGLGAAKKFNSKKVAVALDARMGEVYWGVYEESVLTTEALKNPSQVSQLNNDFIGVGTGWGAYQSELCKQTMIDNFAADFYPKSENLIDLYLSKTNAVDKGLPLPTYLRNNVAKKSQKVLK
ncbi:TsaB protein, required for threonylcarbamoyladenosine (t(6)A) formation in tRNA [uncultured Candidatus Thioglobus sp.]|nr:TsaB protein, required for threonylcarbamoyladenosine (t(6)A) formation in tRNA [uncultured Candidatus Thioglobus sp.]